MSRWCGTCGEKIEHHPRVVSLGLRIQYESAARNVHEAHALGRAAGRACPVTNALPGAESAVYRRAFTPEGEPSGEFTVFERAKMRGLR